MSFRNIFPVLLLTLVNTLGFSILIPVLPFIVKDFGASDIFFGVLLSLYSAFQFFAAPFLGSLSDHWGRKKILLITQLGTLCSWGLFGGAYFVSDIFILGLALPLWIIALARITDGITGGNVSTTNAYLSDITSKENKAQAFGYSSAVFGLGMIVGPAIGGWTMSFEIGFLGTALFAFSLSLFTLIVIYFFLDESLVPSDRTADFDHNLWHQVNLWGRIQKWSDQVILQRVLALRFLFGLVLAAYTSVISLYAIDFFSFGARELALFLTFVGSFMIFNQVFLVRPINQYLGTFWTLVLAQLLLGIGLILMPFTESIYWFTAFYYLTNLGVSVMLPTIMGYLTNHTKKSEQGEITGVAESIGSFSLAIAPVISGAIYQMINGQAFMAYGVFMLIVMGWFLYAGRACLGYRKV